MVGLGGAGQRLLRHFREQLGESTQFGAYRVRNRREVITRKLTVDKKKNVAQFYNLKLFGSLGEGLAWKPDIAVVANPTHLHLETALAAAEAGCHVLVEKPLSHSLAGVEKLQEALGRTGKIGMVAYMMRFHPCLRRISDVLRSGRLGRPLWARFEAGSYVPDWHPYEDYKELYAVRKEMGGGVILTESHDLDLATWFFGAPTRVAAMGGKLTKHAGDAEDTASLLLDFGFPVHVNVCMMQRPAGRSLQITCERGRIEWNGEAVLRVYDADKGAWAETTEPGHDRDHLFRDEVQHFLACVQGREKPAVDVAAGRASLEIALQALAQIRR